MLFNPAGTPVSHLVNLCSLTAKVIFTRFWHQPICVISIHYNSQLQKPTIHNYDRQAHELVTSLIFNWKNHVKVFIILNSAVVSVRLVDSSFSPQLGEIAGFSFVP